MEYTDKNILNNQELYVYSKNSSKHPMGSNHKIINKQNIILSKEQKHIGTETYSEIQTPPGSMPPMLQETPSAFFVTMSSSSYEDPNQLVYKINNDTNKNCNENNNHIHIKQKQNINHNNNNHINNINDHRNIINRQTEIDIDSNSSTSITSCQIDQYDHDTIKTDENNTNNNNNNNLNISQNDHENLNQPTSQYIEDKRLSRSENNKYNNTTPKSHKNESTTGWFHAKIKVRSSIQWANNYKIQFMMFFIFLSGMITTIILTLNNNKINFSVGLCCGSIISIIACSAVIYTYIKQPGWKKHPNSLIFYRSLCDLGLVISLLATTLSEKIFSNTTNGQGCYAVAGLAQFFLFGSESWFFVMSIDMLQSLRSPFTDFKKNLKKYHIFVWGVSFLMMILLVSIPDAAGFSEFKYCWTKAGNKMDENGMKRKASFWRLNIRSWLFFYIWLLFYWVYAIGVMCFAWKRLKEGLAETLRMRLRVLHSVTLYVIAIIIYWGLTFLVYAPYLLKNVPNCDLGTECDSVNWLSQLMSFMITCKGYFDFVVWFQINELTYSDGLFHINNPKNNTTNDKTNNPINKNDTIDVDIDLSPQVNLALRCEVLYYTTSGIIQAVTDTHRLPPGATQQELYLQPQGINDEQTNRNTLGVDDYLLTEHDKLGKKSFHPIKKNGTLFVDYCPHTFQLIREHFGIDNEQYIESLSKTTKERLSEGASGAFMFFSADQFLIVKSMSNEEATFLRSIASTYANYLISNPDTLLTRFFGCHAIRLYGNTFYFVVMANLFSNINENMIIHRRYDIKGSWVNRSAKYPKKGKKVTCRHCNGKYVFIPTNYDNQNNIMNCPMRVGKHEPNTVLKDNDLTAKVRLDNKTSIELYNQLVMDAEFLSSLGIMDYSLLLGVHNVEYIVQNDLNTNDTNNKTINIIDNKYNIQEFDIINKERYVITKNNINHHNMTSTTTKNNNKSNEFIHNSTNHLNNLNHNSQNSPNNILHHTNRIVNVNTGTWKANTVVGPSCYYFGIIDILQTWNINKKLERFTKIYILGKDPNGLSAIAPLPYKERFCLKMADLLGVHLNIEKINKKNIVGAMSTNDIMGEEYDNEKLSHDERINNYNHLNDNNNNNHLNTNLSDFISPYDRRFM